MSQRCLQMLYITASCSPCQGPCRQEGFRPAAKGEVWDEYLETCNHQPAFCQRMVCACRSWARAKAVRISRKCCGLDCNAQHPTMQIGIGEGLTHWLSDGFLSLLKRGACRRSRGSQQRIQSSHSAPGSLAASTPTLAGIQELEFMIAAIQSLSAAAGYIGTKAFQLKRRASERVACRISGTMMDERMEQDHM